ncbi:MAG: DNA/RNA nuclease SfsA [Lachnospiraceae bacterium]|jgi:sugar fermentation stimulation protein A|nr:DNA/RNA nuclease SfsA [Lachnospiraceae bacterium]MDD6147873.1 DNA/RNA nuclease SfsA [Lachnospiraceae bacterium]MDY5705100.1 DNA/RNA nuclease SfsA [Lachnospiraceae bacterium]
MRYVDTCRATFVSRPNRFIAYVKISRDEEPIAVHVKNTGRCKELLRPGCTVILEKAKNPERKTPYDLVSVYLEDGRLINMDSQSPNAMVKEYLETQSYDYIKPEFKYGDSRIDFYMEKGEDKFLLEIKGCTLERDGIGYFPDAPTIRGTKHLEELTKALDQGFHAALGFVIQMPDIKEVRSNDEMDPAFGEALRRARAAGVQVFFFLCQIEENQVRIVSCRKDGTD